MITDAEHISSLWGVNFTTLSRLLKGSVTGVRQAPAAGGIAITSRIGRFLLEGEDVPASVVVKVRNPEWQHPELYHREVRFYRELAPDLGDAVPQCYHARLDEESGDFCLLLEDLSEARPGHRLEGLNRDEACAVARAVGHIHGRFWESSRASDWPEKRYTPEAIARICGRFEHTWPQLLEQGRYAVPEPLHDAVQALREQLPADLEALSAAQPKTLIHSDLHAENLLLDGPRVVIIDWQNTAFAHPAFDLAGVLLSSAHSVHAAGWAPILDAWREAAVAAGAPALDVEAAARCALAGVRWSFVGVSGWLVTFEAEHIRDASTLQGHWARMAAALSAPFI